MRQFQPGDLVVCETASSTYNYHLRVIGPEGIKLSGAFETHALCGRKIGWDTKIPLSGYGSSRSHIPESWCGECRKIAEDKGHKIL